MVESLDNPECVTKNRLRDDLETLGLRRGAVVMLHASVKQIGWIVGGPDQVLQAILDVIGGAGTLMMLVSWEGHTYDLRDWPADRRRLYGRHCPGYDPKTSRADHREMGILAEYLRTWPGACRSRHPFSYAAVSGRAEYMVADHPWQYRDGAGSPLAKLCEAGGKVLLLGELYANVTLLHHAEHLADVEDKQIDRYTMPVMRDGKRVWMEFEEYDTTGGIVPWPEDYFPVIVKEYLQSGKGQTGQVGLAESSLFDAESLKRFGVQWMEEHF